MFYNNTFYWGENASRYTTNIWQTNRTFGDTKFFNTTANRFVDSGTVTEGRNGNLETTFSISGQATQKQPFGRVLGKRCFKNMQGNTHAEV